jgi:hypothetical protein
LLFIMLRRLGTQWEIAIFLGVLFSINPVVCQGVAWVPGRNDLMLTLFFLIAVLAFHQYAGTGKMVWLFVHALSLCAALFTKETAIVLPVIMIVFSRIVQKNNRLTITLAVVYIVLLTGWFVCRQAVLPDNAQAINFRADPVTLFKSMLLNVSKVIFPQQLSVYPLLSVSKLFMSAVTISLFVMLILFLGIRNRNLFLFALVWGISVIMLPVFIISARHDAEQYENRLYTALPAMIVLLAQFRLSYDKLSLRLLSLAVLVYFATQTHIRLRDYRDKLSFAAAGIKGDPAFYLFYHVIGEELFHQGKYDEAINYENRAIKCRPDMPELYASRAVEFYSIGRFNDALNDCEQSILLGGDIRKAHYNRMLIRLSLNHAEDAFDDLKFLQQHYPGTVEPSIINEVMKKMGNAGQAPAHPKPQPD